MTHTYPKLHNAMWPGLVGKGPDSEPPIDLDTMLDLTANAEVDGVKFDGVDLFLADPHTSIDVDDSGIEALADKVRAKGLEIGSGVAPVWPPVGGGSAMATTSVTVSPSARRRPGIGSMLITLPTSSAVESVSSSRTFQRRSARSAASRF